MAWTPYRRQRGADGAVGSDRLCTVSAYAVVGDEELLQPADLALLQCVADCNGTFVPQTVSSQSVQGPRTAFGECRLHAQV